MIIHKKDPIGERESMRGKVLIVDDQFGIRILLQEVLQKDGYEVNLASNGKQALDLIKKRLPDLVILDMKIPGMDGLEILEAIKQIDEKIHVIMMTAYGEMELMKKAKELGAVAYFTKPFNIDELREAIGQYITHPKETKHS